MPSKDDFFTKEANRKKWVSGQNWENLAKHISSLANEQKLEYMGNELNENKRLLQEELQLQNVGHPPANWMNEET